MRRIATGERRAALLGAAARVVARDGVAAASVRAVAEEAGMPAASVHYVFDSRDAMLRELVDDVLDAQRAAVAGSTTAAATLPAFVAGALQGWLDRALAAPDGEVLLHELVHWSRRAPGGQGLAADLYRAYHAAVLGVVHEARARFGAAWTLPDEDVARFALVLTDGVAARWLVDRDAAAARRMLAFGAEALLALLEGTRS